MPYINSRLTVKLTEEEKETIKARLGHIISEIPGKSEQWLMVTFNDNDTIYFKGKKMEKAAFIDVKVAGTTERKYKNAVAALISSLLEEKLSIPKDSVFITFSDIADWAWNGELF